MAFKDVMDSIIDSTNDAVQIAKLKSKIGKEKSNIKAKYAEIGEQVYKKFTTGGTVDIDLVDMLDEITSSKKHIQELNQAITEIKMD